MKSNTSLITPRATRLAAFTLALTAMLAMPVTATSVDSRNDNASDSMANHNAPARPAARPSAPAAPVRHGLLRAPLGHRRLGPRLPGPQLLGQPPPIGQPPPAGQRQRAPTLPNTLTLPGQARHDPTPPVRAIRDRQVVMLMAPSRITVDRVDTEMRVEVANSGTPRTTAAAEISMAEATFLTIASAPASAMTISFTSAIRP